jgi:predicted transcriptional regulator
MVGTGEGDLMGIEPVTEGELSILEVIWEQETPTSRDIADAIYEKVTDSKMASVQKLLERLETKGCVNRDRRERAHRFRALVSREDFLRHRLEGLADRLCDGAIVPLVTTLLRSKKGLSRKNVDQLRRLIDELWPADQR